MSSVLSMYVLGSVVCVPLCWLDKNTAMAINSKLETSIWEQPEGPLLKGATLSGELTVHALQKPEPRIDHSDRVLAPGGTGEMPKEAAPHVHAVRIALPGDLQ